MRWSLAGTTWTVLTDDAGTGTPVLMLPALSSISTREEMRPLAHALGPGLRTLTSDWPGFGAGPAPTARLGPDVMRRFLADLLAGLREPLGGRPPAVVAAGHAAAYVLDHAARHPGAIARLALVAPTWRGPFPTMMQGRRPVQDRIRRVIETPLLGQLLYAVNLSRPLVRTMLKEHVMEDPAAVTQGYLAAKAAVIGRRNARFGTAAFVTGGLDPFHSRKELLAAARAVREPILLVHGAGGPPRSMAEMEALAGVPGVRSIRLPAGRLGVHEEHPDAVARALRPFLLDPQASKGVALATL